MQSINPAILIEKGVHHGHLAKNWDPSFKPYLFMVKNGYHIIHIEATIRGLQQAAGALKKITEEGKKILFVGTKKQIKATVEETAKALQQPYVTKKWLGGMLTNFNTIKKTLKNLRKVSEHKDDPAYLFATKKERGQKDRKQAKLEASFQGMKDLAYLPAALFVVDVKHEYTAVLEAQKIGIPIFAIVDSNVPTHAIQYPIPGNDDTVSAVSILLELLKPSILEGVQAWKERKSSPTDKSPLATDGSIPLREKSVPSKVKKGTPQTLESNKANTSSMRKEQVAPANATAKTKKVAPTSQHSNSSKSNTAAQQPNTFKNKVANDATAAISTKNQSTIYKPTRKQIATLHKHTGLGVQACYNALKETKGDLEKATERLFKQAGQLARKRVGREIKAGRIFVAKNKNNNFIVLLCLGSETDFVAKNDSFKQLGTNLAQSAAEHTISDQKTLLQSKYKDKTWQDAIVKLSGSTGEHISITQYTTIQAETVGGYVHTGGRIAAILGLNTSVASNSNVQQLADDLAMHVVANEPMAIDEANMDAALLVEIKQTMLDSLKEAQKNNPVIRDKAITGKMKKFLEENMLMEQPFLKDESKLVRQILVEISPNLQVTQFQRFQVYT